MRSPARSISIFAAPLLLSACVGGWAQSTDVTLVPVAPSHVSARANVALAVSCASRCAPTGGTDIMLSASGTVAVHRYAVVLAHGACDRPNIAGTALGPDPDLDVSQSGKWHLEIPLHSLVKSDYILVLRDVTAGRAVACGAIHSDALW